VLVYVNKKIKIWKNKKKNKRDQENICIIFFTFLALYLIRLQVVGAVVLIHPVFYFNLFAHFYLYFLFLIIPVLNLDNSIQAV
jgi:hypothetical protein